jgi:hypothetical protein
MDRKHALGRIAAGDYLLLSTRRRDQGEVNMGWEEGISIATRERCGVCHKVSPIGFHVPNEVWLIAVPDYFRETVLCLSCFTSFADERLIAWDEAITFYPVSLRTLLEGARGLTISPTPSL